MPGRIFRVVRALQESQPSRRRRFKESVGATDAHWRWRGQRPVRDACLPRKRRRGQRPSVEFRGRCKSTVRAGEKHLRWNSGPKKFDRNSRFKQVNSIWLRFFGKCWHSNFDNRDQGVHTSYPRLRHRWIVQKARISFVRSNMVWKQSIRSIVPQKISIISNRSQQPWRPLLSRPTATQIVSLETK